MKKSCRMILLISSFLFLSYSTHASASGEEATLTLYNNTTYDAVFHLVMKNENKVKMIGPFAKRTASYPIGTKIHISCTIEGNTYWEKIKLDQDQQVSTSSIVH